MLAELRTTPLHLRDIKLQKVQTVAEAVDLAWVKTLLNCCLLFFLVLPGELLLLKVGLMRFKRVAVHVTVQALFSASRKRRIFNSRVISEDNLLVPIHSSHSWRCTTDRRPRLAAQV